MQDESKRAAAVGAAGGAQQDDDSSNSASDEGETSKKPKAHTTRRDGRLYVEKNSLNESQLVAGRDAARFELQRLTELGRATEDDIKKDKRAANRLSAFQSRKRRVGVLVDLEQKTSQLQNDNKEQASQISDQGAQIRLLTAENERLRDEIENRKTKRRGATTTTSSSSAPGDDASTMGGSAAGGATDSGLGASSAAESNHDNKRESVQSMLVHLQTVQAQQQVDRDNLSQKQSREQNELSLVQRHQQEQLDMVQSQEQEQLSTGQQQAKSQLTTAQDQQMLGVLHGFGLPATGDRNEAIALVGQLAKKNVSSRTSLSLTQTATAQECTSSNTGRTQSPIGSSNDDNDSGAAAGRAAGC
jgi:hypothetical protein